VVDTESCVIVLSTRLELKKCKMLFSWWWPQAKVTFHSFFPYLVVNGASFKGLLKGLVSCLFCLSKI